MVYWCRWLLWIDMFASFFSTNISIIIIDSYNWCIATYWSYTSHVTTDRVDYYQWLRCALYDEASITCQHSPYDRVPFANTRWHGPHGIHIWYCIDKMRQSYFKWDATWDVFFARGDIWSYISFGGSNELFRRHYDIYSTRYSYLGENITCLFIHY